MKKIKTESGRKIAASYKSQSYQRWRERHKLETIVAGDREGDSHGASTGEHSTSQFLINWDTSFSPT